MTKKETVILADRVKKDEWRFDVRAKMWQDKNSSEVTIQSSNGVKYIVPMEKKTKYQRVYINMKKSWFRTIWSWVKMWPIEAGNMLEWNDDLSVQSNPLLDQPSVNAAVARISLRKLAAGVGGGTGIAMILLAAVAALAVGYIMYPQFNHPAPIYACFKILANSTQVPEVCPIP